ncbi:GNAT family N-acetyltransferase [Rhizobium sp. SL86]|uniref:GNAT family N-acetyltransferase n=1 Tax=Rhizobium sp. SL86 TaxID=2995148 RepID=UPI00227570F3|nr:GNAT family N-acetyltransferase [Rhizobium sp. SL86]MCY1663928.1 GNAT family N-acetyltransferase [Rhizobium sp. SL86]
MHTNRPAMTEGAEQTPRVEHPTVSAALALEFDLVTDLGQVETDWRALEAHSCNSLHQGFDWSRAWSEKSGEQVVVLRGQRDARTLFLLPLSLKLRHGTRQAGFPGGRYNNLNTGLFAADFVPSADEQREIATRLKSLLHGRADMIVLEAVPREWRGHRHPLASLAVQEHANHSFQLPLFSRFEETLAQINAKRRRKKFRVQTRRMEEIGGYDYVTPQTASERHALLDLFFQQKSVRFRTQGLPDVFADAKVRAFLHALLDVPPHGHDHPLVLHAIRLRRGGEKDIPAIAGLSRKGDHIICQFGSIDESRVPDTSPGELLFWHMIEEACGTGAALFDFGVGDQLYKRSWCPVETVQYDIVLPISLKGHIAARAHTAVTRTKAVIKRNPLLYRVLQRIRSAQATAPSDRDD